MKYWLMKSEPDVFSFDDLKKRPKKTEPWDGVRNYQARNMMRDEMSIGDKILFYHSNTQPPHIAGIAEVASKAYPDPTAFDKKSKYYDEKSDPDNPTWMLVDVRYVEPLAKIVTLEQLKAESTLKDMKVVQRFQRLSVQPVTLKEFKKVCKMGGL